MSQIIDENILWKAVEKLLDKVDPTDHREVVLGLVFLKYVSDKYQAKYNELSSRNDGSELDSDYYIEDNIFLVPQKALWSYIVSYSKQPEIGQVIDNAFLELEKNNDQLNGILPKIYSKSSLDKMALGELVDFFDNNLNAQDLDSDFFGQVYEYYISAFDKHFPTTTKLGDFFTPKCISELMVEILEPYQGRVYDPCCGSGGMFVQCSKFVKEHQGEIYDISIYGQESNQVIWKIAKMNLVFRGLEANLGPRNADSFSNDLHKDEKFDFIIANPPYNLKKYWNPSFEADPRWIFGDPDKTNANYAWLSLIYYKLKETGKAAILMPSGAKISKTKDDYKIRKAMIESGHIDAIITLPNKLFDAFSISGECWILNKAKTNKDILFINADNLGNLVSGKNRVLELSDIQKIVQTYKDYKNNNLDDLPGFSKKADFESIIENDYSLNPRMYVGFDESNKLSTEEIEQEIKKASAELFKLIKEEKKLEEKFQEILEKEIM